MPKPIDLTDSTPPTRPPQQPQVPRSAVVVTADDLSVAPPAGIPGISGGVRNGPPLPTGRPVRMTNLERQQFEAAQLPPTAGPNLRKVMAAAEAEARAEVDAAGQVPPVDPSRKPVEFNPIPIENLTAQQQASVRQQMAAVLDPTTSVVGAQTSTGVQGTPSKPPPMQETMWFNPDVHKAARPPPGAAGLPPGLLDPAIEHMMASNQHVQNIKELDLNPYDAPATEAATETVDKADPAVTANAHRTEDPVAPRTHCPHCGWDQSVSDDPEPEHHEKIAFLQTFTGQKPFLKAYRIMAGAVIITFRTLEISEVDACFRQAYADKDAGRLVNDFDRWEAVNRYRLCLQLYRLTSDGNFDHEQPDGLNAAVAPNATAYWKTKPDDQEPLRTIEKYIRQKVLRSESMARVVQQECDRFNRLVARLEGLKDNDSFWQATELRS